MGRQNCETSRTSQTLVLTAEGKSLQEGLQQISTSLQLLE